jgi:ABC-2 type transport system ATP-binding protein/ribosome-dependent ATPase
MEEADQCDRVVMLTGGRVVASGTVDEIVAGVQSAGTRAERFEERFARLIQQGEAQGAVPA